MKKNKFSISQISSFKDFKYEKKRLNLNRKLIETKVEFSLQYFRTISLSGVKTILTTLKNT